MKVCSFFAVFGPKMYQKRVKPQFFGIVGLSINVPNDPGKDKKKILQKCGQKLDFSILGGLTPI